MSDVDSTPDPDRDAVDTGCSVGGTYTLLIHVPTAVTVEVGALGAYELPAGPYAYTGSALGAGGFSRVDRHRRVARGDHDVRHWHIDYLLGRPDTDLTSVVRSVGIDAECAVTGRLPTGPIDGFGASDCDCESHLATGSTLSGLVARVRGAHEAAVARRDGDESGGLVEIDVVPGEPESVNR